MSLPTKNRQWHLYAVVCPIVGRPFCFTATSDPHSLPRQALRGSEARKREEALLSLGAFPIFKPLARSTDKAEILALKAALARNLSTLPLPHQH